VRRFPLPFVPFLSCLLFPFLSPPLSSPFIPTLSRATAKRSGKRLSFLLSGPVEPTHQTICGAFWASGEKNFSAVHELIASAHKRQAFLWRKTAKRRQITMSAIGATTVGTGGDNNVLVPQLLGRSFQKARNFTTSSHQNAGFSI